MTFFAPSVLDFFRAIRLPKESTDTESTKGEIIELISSRTAPSLPEGELIKQSLFMLCVGSYYTAQTCTRDGPFGYRRVCIL